MGGETKKTRPVFIGPDFECYIRAFKDENETEPIFDKSYAVVQTKHPTIYLRYTVRNIGFITSTDFAVKIVVMMNGHVDEETVAISGLKSVYMLSAHPDQAAKTLPREIVLKDSPNDQYHFGIMMTADPTNAVSEMREFNNVAMFSCVLWA